LRVLYLTFDHIPEERRLVEEHRSLARTEHRLEASGVWNLQKVTSGVFAPKPKGPEDSAQG
jgi:hypothetical protein